LFKVGNQLIAVAGDVWSATLDQLRTCGAGRRECVVYWVGPAQTAGLVTRVVHPIHTAKPWHYQVDDAWLTQFWLGLASTHESVRLQVHTHGGRAFHSPTDDAGALVYQQGFLSLVLPGFAMRNDCLRQAFLAELDGAGIWHPVRFREKLAWT
jgi:hypothetical protein